MGHQLMRFFGTPALDDAMGASRRTGGASIQIRSSWSDAGFDLSSHARFARRKRPTRRTVPVGGGREDGPRRIDAYLHDRRWQCDGRPPAYDELVSAGVAAGPRICAPRRGAIIRARSGRSARRHPGVSMSVPSAWTEPPAHRRRRHGFRYQAQESGNEARSAFPHRALFALPSHRLRRRRRHH